MRRFGTKFLKEADEFMPGMRPAVIRKIFFNIELAEQTNDPKVFKKLHSEIWEFRIKYGRLQIRLLAFWDKTDNKETLVVATHGFLKKTDKVPGKEIDRAIRLRENYFKNR